MGREDCRRRGKGGGLEKDKGDLEKEGEIEGGE